MNLATPAPVIRRSESLLSDIALGNVAALGDLYREHVGNIFRFVLQILGNRADAEEVVTDTFLDIWRNADKYLGEARALTWMLGIARHKALDRLRARRPQGTHVEEWSAQADATPCPTLNPCDRLIGFETGSAIYACLSRLPLEQRECFWLVFYNDFSVEEVADVQGVPANTVKTRLFYARHKLRGLLQDRAVELNEAVSPVALDTVHAMAHAG